MFKKIFLILFFIPTLFYQTLAQIDIPDAPQFISASIIPESYPICLNIKWIESDSLDVQGYIVYHVVNSITETLDTVWGRETTEFSYSNLGTYQTAKRFRLVSFDNQFYKSNITSPHTTIYLDFEYDKCDRIVNLKWTEYEGWNKVSNYNIYRRKSGHSYEIIKTVLGDITTYQDNSVDFDNSYYYYIEAISDKNYSATSNSIKINTETYNPPQFLNTKYASVVNNEISLEFVVDNTAQVAEYRLQRSKIKDGEYNTIKIIPNNGQDVIVVTDSEVDVNNEIYYYRLASVNPCAKLNSFSNIACNILLETESASDLNHFLSWNPYEEWTNGVFNYKIYRVFNSVESEIETSPTDVLNYTYNIEWYVKYCHNLKINTSNKYCYFIEAIENQGHISSLQRASSRSNISCVYEEPVFWIPNAFNLSSLEPENRIFKPVISFVQDEPFEFSIYDKYGMKIFHTNKTFEAWDGTIKKGHLAPSQYYTYYVKYYDFNNKEHIKTGIFFLFIQ